MCPATTPGGAPGNFYSFAENTLKNRKPNLFELEFRNFGWGKMRLFPGEVLSRARALLRSSILRSLERNGAWASSKETMTGTQSRSTFSYVVKIYNPVGCGLHSRTPEPFSFSLFRKSWFTKWRSFVWNKNCFLFNSFIFEIGFVAFGHFPEEFSGPNGSRLPWWILHLLCSQGMYILNRKSLEAFYIYISNPSRRNLMDRFSSRTLFLSDTCRAPSKKTKTFDFFQVRTIENLKKVSRYYVIRSRDELLFSFGTAAALALVT